MIQLDHYKPTTADERVRLIASELLSPVRDPDIHAKIWSQTFLFSGVSVNATFARDSRTAPLKPVRFIVQVAGNEINCDSSAFAAACYIDGYLGGRQSAGYC